jgi:hypothetical protein
MGTVHRFANSEKKPNHAVKMIPIGDHLPRPDQLVRFKLKGDERIVYGTTCTLQHFQHRWLVFVYESAWSASPGQGRLDPARIYFADEVECWEAIP